jgi:hypothetical protein
VGAAIDGKLRVVPSLKTIESEFIAVVDLSRSMLEGFISLYQSAPVRDRSGKLNALFFAVAAFLHLAAGMGFRLRVVLSSGKRTAQERGGPPLALMHSTLSRMRSVLRLSRDRAEANRELSQEFNLRTALEVPIGVRTRGVVVVVSDFLDPFPSYRSALHTLSLRHHVILADSASKRDRNYPVPGKHDHEKRRTLVREGARHLEQNTEPRVNNEDTVPPWNDERQRDHKSLVDLAHASGITYRELAKAVGSGGEAGFLRCYRIAFDHLRQLM